MSSRLTYRPPGQSELARNGSVDAAAPIQGSGSITINAPVEQVWAVLTDVANWADSLEPGVTKIELPQGVQVGAPMAILYSSAQLDKALAASLASMKRACEQ